MRLEAGSVIEAAELRELSDEALSERLELLRVVARVSPLDKMRIVEAFQRAGKVVAMTGDGVNDAPSIKRADVGVAMGSGTAVARDVADLVLLDDNFVTIVAAVEEGRQIRSNLKKVLVYLLSDTADALFLIGGALVFGLALPLNALQILWVNFFSDSFPAVAFAFEREREAVRRRSKDALFDPLMLFLIIAIGTSTSALLFGLYYFLLASGHPAELVRTFTFACFASYTLFSVLALRSLSRSIFSYSFFSNPAMLAGVCVGATLILVAVYVPFFGRLLDTVPLPLPWMLGVAGVVLANLAAIELAKGLFRWQERRRFMESSRNAQDTERAITRTRFH
jgi:Ca2+-transporting ATPase